MKRVAVWVVVAAIATACFMGGCADNFTVNGKTYKSYGLINEDERRDSGIEYELCLGNLVWTVILFETVIAPVYFLGFSIMEPVGVKQ